MWSGFGLGRELVRWDAMDGLVGGVMHLLLNVSRGSWLTSVSGNAKLRNLTLYNFVSSA